MTIKTSDKENGIEQRIDYDVFTPFGKKVYAIIIFLIQGWFSMAYVEYDEDDFEFKIFIEFPITKEEYDNPIATADGYTKLGGKEIFDIDVKVNSEINETDAKRNAKTLTKEFVEYFILQNKTN